MVDDECEKYLHMKYSLRLVIGMCMYGRPQDGHARCRPGCYTGYPAIFLSTEVSILETSLMGTEILISRPAGRASSAQQYLLVFGSDIHSSVGSKDFRDETSGETTVRSLPSGCVTVMISVNQGLGTVINFGSR